MTNLFTLTFPEELGITQLIVETDGFPRYIYIVAIDTKICCLVKIGEGVSVMNIIGLQ